MVKQIQTIRRQIADKLFQFVWPFCELGAERVNKFLKVLCATELLKVLQMTDIVMVCSQLLY